MSEMSYLSMLEFPRGPISSFLASLERGLIRLPTTSARAPTSGCENLRTATVGGRTADEERFCRTSCELRLKSMNRKDPVGPRGNEG